MDYKKEIEKVLFSLKMKGMERSDVERKLGRSVNWIDQTLSRGGNKKALHLLQTLDNVETSNVNEPGPERYDSNPHPDHVKYVRLLEDNIEFLKGVMTSNLGNISASQQHLRALAIAQLNQMAKLRAREEGKSVAKVMAEINKEVADAALSIEQKDILAGILGKDG
jgi:hypothetical protein